MYAQVIKMSRKKKKRSPKRSSNTPNWDKINELWKKVPAGHYGILRDGEIVSTTEIKIDYGSRSFKVDHVLKGRSIDELRKLDRRTINV